MPVQVLNTELIGLLEAHFQPRNEPQFAWKSACSAFLALPALRAFWPMSVVDYQNPQATDVSGNSYNLTNNNSCDFSYEDLRPYVDFPGTNEYLSRASAAGNWANILGNELYIPSAQQGLTIGGWFWVDTFGGDDGLAGKYNTVGNQRSYLLFANGANTRFSFIVSGNGVAIVQVNSAALATGAWHFAVGRFDPSTIVELFVDGTWYNNAVGVPATLHDGTADFNVGAFNNGGAGTYLDGRASMVFLCAADIPDAAVFSCWHQTRAMYGV